MIKRCLQTELEEHLGYPKHGRKGEEQSNVRNGKSTKKRKREHGALEITVPRDRDGSFEPMLVKKRQTRLEGFLRENPGPLRPWYDDQGHSGPASGTLWGGGLADLHLEWNRRGHGRGTKVGRTAPWKRSIPSCTWIGCRVKVRENQRVTNKAVYLALGMTMEGQNLDRLTPGGVWGVPK